MNDMKTRQKRDWLDEMFDYEVKHPVVFASPRALFEARLIAALGNRRKHFADTSAEIDNVRRNRRRK
jgi:hypothetical protein